jgi:hypothetical protein
MADLTLAAIPVRVLRDTWIRRMSIYQGGRLRARANNLISTEGAEKRSYDCAIDLYDAFEEAALRAACPRGVAVAIEGDLPEVGFSGIVDIGDTQFLLMNIDGTDSLLRTAAVHIEEV